MILNKAMSRIFPVIPSGRGRTIAGSTLSGSSPSIISVRVSNSARAQDLTASFRAVRSPVSSSSFISSRGMPAYFSTNDRTSFLLHFPSKHVFTACSHNFIESLLHRFVCVCSLRFSLSERWLSVTGSLQSDLPLLLLTTRPAHGPTPWNSPGSGFTDFCFRMDMQAHFTDSHRLVRYRRGRPFQFEFDGALLPFSPARPALPPLFKLQRRHGERTPVEFVP